MKRIPILESIEQLKTFPKNAWKWGYVRPESVDILSPIDTGTYVLMNSGKLIVCPIDTQRLSNYLDADAAGLLKEDPLYQGVNNES